MNEQQNVILWIGILLVLVYLFTDKTFTQSLFSGGLTTPASAASTNTNTSSSNFGQILKNAAGNAFKQIIEYG